MTVSAATVLISGAVLGAGTYAGRVAGPLLRRRVEVSERAEALLSRASVVLLAALCATAALYDGRDLAGVARPVAVLVAGVLAWRRAPFVVVVLTAAAVAAGLRLLGVQVAAGFETGPRGPSSTSTHTRRFRDGPQGALLNQHSHPPLSRRAPGGPPRPALTPAG